MTSGALDISKTPIHFDADGSVVCLEDFNFDGASFAGYIEEHTTAAPGHLMMIEQSPSDWPTWEQHPEGSEVVFIVSGRGTFYQQFDQGEVAIPFSAGTTIINPPGVWHTADVTEAMTAIYLTPCPGTDHKPR